MKKKFKKIELMDIVVFLILTIIIMITLYPFLNVLALSISGQSAVAAGQVGLIPKGINLDSYQYVFQDPTIFRAYFNTVMYAATGTVIGLLVSSLMAYPLSFKYTKRKVIMKILVFTMFFNGGMIPMFLLIKNLGLIDHMWSLILPGALSVWNVIIFRSFFMNVPDSMRESALIDGASEFRIYWGIFIPLSKPVFSALGLFTAVGIWNKYFDAMLYINDTKKFPLSVILRQLLIQNQYNFAEIMQQHNLLINAESIKAATIIVTILPIVCVYPFLQKYFMKGIMIGAIKG